MGYFTIILMDGRRGDCNLDIDCDHQEIMPQWNTYQEAVEWAKDQLSDRDHYLIVCTMYENIGEDNAE